jgi:hypothetical protein
LHRQTVRTVTVADAADKRCLEGPDGVAESFLFMGAEGSHGLFFGQVFKPVVIDPAENFSSMTLNISTK